MLIYVNNDFSVLGSHACTKQLQYEGCENVLPEEEVGI